MSEAEFERLLDAVNAAVAPIPQEDFVIRHDDVRSRAGACQRQRLAWPLIPFPDGWHAAC